MFTFVLSKENMETLGEIIKKTLKDKGIKESYVADKMGVSKQVINQIDRRKNFDAEFLKKLEDIVDIDFSVYMPAQTSRHITTSIPDVPKSTDIYASVSTAVDPEKGIPMYNAPGAGSSIEIYTDNNSNKVIGYLSFPGVTKECIALQVFGESMYPTLENGVWAVMRPIMNRVDIAWGEVYYIEWGDFRMFKRILLSDKDDEIILWSDNQSAIINERPVYGPIRIKKTEIRALWLVTDTYRRSSN